MARELFYYPNEIRELPPHILGDPELPVAACRDLVEQTILSHPAVVITANTGTGKSTQIAQYAANLGFEVVCTQPRVVAARALATHVCSQVMNVLGEAGRSYVGYRTAPERNDHPDNRIRYHTDGLELKRMLSCRKPHSRPFLLITDEVHEGKAATEMTLAVAKERLQWDPNFRLVVMSATMDATKVASWLGSAAAPAPIIHIPGRTFDITELATNDTLSEVAIKYAKLNMTSIVFVPGKEDIQAELSRISRVLGSTANIVGLHGEQSPSDQARALRSTDSKKPSIILSTAIGQTSLTIPHADVVIDSGWTRGAQLDAYGAPVLTIEPAPLATRDQRRGRVGRVRPGTYVQAQLEGYPEAPKTQDLPPYDIPEIQRINLDQIALMLGQLGRRLEDFDTLHSIPHGEFTRSQTRLKRIGALTLRNTLTNTGELMADMPLDPQYARRIVESIQNNDPVGIQAQIIAICAIESMQGITRTGGNGVQPWHKYALPRPAKGNHPAEPSIVSDSINSLRVFIAAMGLPESHLEQHGIITTRFLKAKELYKRICSHYDIDTELHRPDAEQTEIIIRRLIAGSPDLFVQRSYGRYGSHYKPIRRHAGPLPGQADATSADLLIGNPWGLENMNNGQISTKHHVINGTAVTAEQLQSAAPERCTYSLLGVSVTPDGKIHQLSELYFDGQKTNQQVIHNPIPSEQVHYCIMRYVLYEHATSPENPRASALRNAYQELRELQERALYNLNVDRIITNLISPIIAKMAAKGTPTTLKELEKYLPRPMNIADLMGKNGAAVIRDILDQSPASITIGDADAAIQYRQGVAHIRMTKLQTYYLHTAQARHEIDRLGEARTIFINGRPFEDVRKKADDLANAYRCDPKDYPRSVPSAPIAATASNVRPQVTGQISQTTRHGKGPTREPNTRRRARI